MVFRSSITKKQAYSLILAAKKVLSKPNQKTHTIKKTLRGNELSNYKFGIFGFGRIGKNVANFLKQFNNNVFYFDPYVKNKLAKKVTNINVFLKKINFLIISAKLTNETNNFFTFKKLKLLKNNSILINVSRGELIKENDLIKLIQSNHFKKVSLDV